MAPAERRSLRNRMTDPGTRAFAALEQVDSRETFFDFVAALRASLAASAAAEADAPSSPYGPDAFGWENPDLAGFLEALEAGGRDQGDRLPAEPGWRLFAELLWMGKIYE